MNHYLFSYVTLQPEKVQLESFGRKLQGQKDILPGYRLAQIEIHDAAVLAKSEQKFHPIAIPTGNTEDFIEGILFEITDEELRQADAYEVSDYKRVWTKFQSGREGWVYIAADK